MKRELVLGAKYFFKDFILDDIVEAQITQLNDVELTYKNLIDNKEYYREIHQIEVCSIISEEEAKSLNNKEVFSVKTDLIKAIISRAEVMKYSEDNFKSLNINENTVLISITDPKSNYLPIEVQKQFNDVLNIQFWDVEEQIGNYKPINEEEALIIREFILKNKNKNFVIHCEAGISRSSGVGLAVLLICEFNCDKYLMATSYNPITSHHRYSPNYAVYDMVSSPYN